jgi:SpoVK/Ycf46/Vps4 family AAA+-type ATPase
MQKPSVVENIQRALLSRYPILYMVTSEEERAEKALQQVAGSLFRPAVPVHTWAATTGLTKNGKAVENTEEPLAALDHIIGSKEAGIYLLKDLHPFLADPAVVRRLRDAYQALLDGKRFLVLLSPLQVIPREIRKEVALVPFDLPSPAELAQVLEGVLGGFSKAGKVKVELPEGERAPFVTALQGLTLNEARHALLRAFSGREVIDGTTLDAVFEEKAQLTRKEGILEFVPQRWLLEEIGGLDNLKDWLLKREKLFKDPDPEARELIPRGVLFMGVSGCGKSMAVKAISSLWNLPLFRLDLGEVFSGSWGTPDEAFANALHTVEVLSPAILWIDEIEMGVAGYVEGAAGIHARIFAAFLTWMQEKPSQIFVAATANRIDLLPPEVIRKGRFDQIFFCDLPSEKEREEIFDVHLRKRGVSTAKLDLQILAKGTKGWNGAEIEQAVVSALTEARAEKREIEEDDLFFQIGKIVPLSKTMSEKIKQIRSWAHDRAISASKP